MAKCQVESGEVLCYSKTGSNQSILNIKYFHLPDQVVSDTVYPEGLDHANMIFSLQFG